MGSLPFVYFLYMGVPASMFLIALGLLLALAVNGVRPALCRDREPVTDQCGPEPHRCTSMTGTSPGARHKV